MEEQASACEKLVGPLQSIGQALVSSLELKDVLGTIIDMRLMPER